MSIPGSQILENVKTAMMQYYTLLCTMPHMDPTCLHMPPSTGWSILDIEALSGRSEAAINFLRHLPYLTPCYNYEAAWLVSLPTPSSHTSKFQVTSVRYLAP